MREFKVRASAGGRIVTNAQGKSKAEKIADLKEAIKSAEIRISEAKNKEAKTFVDLANEKIPSYKKEILELESLPDEIMLSTGTKTFVDEWLKEQIYGFRKEIKNKYLTKGLALEDEGIDSAISWLDLPFVLKNEKSFEDEFFTGTPDLILSDEILDIKCSWDAFTFPLFEKECPTKDYFYQLQIYMHLTGKRKARVVYVLLNTPEELVYEQKRDYSEMDKKYRIKTFAFEYDQSIILDLQDRISKIREYIQTIKL